MKATKQNILKLAEIIYFGYNRKVKVVKTGKGRGTKYRVLVSGDLYDLRRSIDAKYYDDFYDFVSDLDKEKELAKDETFKVIDEF